MLYVLAPVPNKLANIDWQEAGKRIRLQVQNQLEDIDAGLTIAWKFPLCDTR